MSTWTRFAVPLALVGVLFLCDASDALAQSSRATMIDSWLAESEPKERRRRRRRATPPPEPEPTDAGSDPAATSGDDAAASTDDTAPGSDTETTDDGGDAEAPFQSKNDNSIGQEPSGDGGSSLRRSDRMDFDERLVKGQGARSGAVYLFKRTPRKLPELVSLRTTYRDRIVSPVLGPNSQRQPEKATPTKAQQPAAQETPTKAPEAEEEVDPRIKARERRRRRRRSLRRRRSRSKNTSAPQKGQ